MKISQRFEENNKTGNKKMRAYLLQGRIEIIVGLENFLNQWIKILRITSIP